MNGFKNEQQESFNIAALKGFQEEHEISANRNS
jgi:hypothetical protein